MLICFTVASSPIKSVTTLARYVESLAFDDEGPRGHGCVTGLILTFGARDGLTRVGFWLTPRLILSQLIRPLQLGTSSPKMELGYSKTSRLPPGSCYKRGFGDVIVGPERLGLGRNAMGNSV
ncbi:hypothetical protein LINPERHAP2_LOCUS9783 [Linum perenne]